MAVGRSKVDAARLEAFGLRIRALRLERGWSQEELAERSHLHRNYVGGVERGEINLSLTNVYAIADGLDVPTTDLVEGEPDSQIARKRVRKPS